VTTDLRQGDLLGLLQRSLVVRMSAHSVKGSVFLAEAKTRSSRRRIALSQAVVTALQEPRVRQHAERVALGSSWDSILDLVFPNTIGRRQRRQELLEGEYEHHLERLGLPAIRFQDLRHTAATILPARGVHVKVVSELLGHADIASTWRVYGHVLPHMQGLAADVMDAVLAGSSANWRQNWRHPRR
jgi:integrase